MTIHYMHTLGLLISLVSYSLCILSSIVEISAFKSVVTCFVGLYYTKIKLWLLMAV